MRTNSAVKGTIAKLRKLKTDDTRNHLPDLLSGGPAGGEGGVRNRSVRSPDLKAWKKVVMLDTVNRIDSECDTYQGPRR